MKKSIAVFLCAGLCLAGDDKPKAEAVKAELKALQGTWKLTQVQVDGKALAWMDVEGMNAKMVVKDEIDFPELFKFRVARFTRVGNDTRPAWRPVLQQIMSKVAEPPKVEEPPPPSVTLNPSTKVKQIDIDRGERGKILGVYAREEDRLIICLAFSGFFRPTEVKADAAKVCLTLVRGNEAAEDKARAKSIQDEQKKLNGDWEVVQGVFDTEKLSEKDRNGFQLAFRGGEVTWKEAEASKTLKIRLAPATQPKAIDLIVTEGPTKGKAIAGLYHLEGDRLTLCLPWSYDKDRPKEIDIKNEKQVNALLVLKRIEK